ncbi:hypothetical protein DL766_000930 [Monosporascus sp. MC13-8B]|uniref:DUF6594 domain-containing protein n=1 Tax=Monosporascus cannonballus TaxID=155416 RepID=A0ABY0HF77_9PEZI|nr:hypothetical protein DL762_003316 [Monosporascus cannonballus]RYP00741.1 hypothetical protein DL763_000621 [Monosporascus cannonballus]RYP38513.1 hypothetical protein DL766_000930 [Monosporascus sp. MC13-8B]
MADSDLHQRTPYESEERLQDKAQKRQMSDILGLDDDKLTNSDPLPLPSMAGAGRVKMFRDGGGKKSSVGSGSTRNGSTERVDIETGAGPGTDFQHSHPRGYPALANLIGSDRDFFIFRRFSSLSARNLLYLQDELMELEARLQKIDLAESLNGSAQELWNLHSRREDANQHRKSIMKEIRTKLNEYQMAIQSQASMLALEPAPSIYADSIANWVDGIKPTVEAESRFLDERGDLGREGPPLSSTVEYYSVGGIKHAARILLALVAAVFAVLPIPILIYFSGTVRILVISVFAVTFAAMFSVMTNGRTPEMIAAMAARNLKVDGATLTKEQLHSS